MCNHTANKLFHQLSKKLPISSHVPKNKKKIEEERKRKPLCHNFNVSDCFYNNNHYYCMGLLRDTQLAIGSCLFFYSYFVCFYHVGFNQSIN